ncbi:MAG: GNAT family N-acetyltransferase [Proteobacteria bacterium]|nr:MAG: GNAT family N-acetyltransferase [Pseudomonadota bacterium]
MNPILDNIAWHTLSGRHAGFSAGTATARRYAAGFSPIIAFADVTQPDLAALKPFCDAGEQFYCADWAGVVPAGWRLAAEARMFRMVWAGAAPAVDEPDGEAIVPLTAAHAASAVALATLTNPGPFGPRTIELGDYIGCFDGGRLVAMAGERMHAGPFHEISGVCTDPGFQGRGLARRLMLALIRRQMQRGETPFLHVMSNNTTAHGLYLRMGFEDYREVPVRVIARL